MTPPAHPAPGDCRSVGQSVYRSVPKHSKMCLQSMERWRVLGNPLGAVQPQVVHRLNQISPARHQLGVFRLSRSRVASHSFALHCFGLHCSALLRFAWIRVALHCFVLHCLLGFALHCFASLRFALHCIALHCCVSNCLLRFALNFIALHCSACFDTLCIALSYTA